MALPYRDWAYLFLKPILFDIVKSVEVLENACKGKEGWNGLWSERERRF